MSAKSNTAVLWQGASRLDGSPIAVLITGLAKQSKNSKTGDMLQTWILRRDVSPTEAIATGADYSICGDCKHRGESVDGHVRNRSCYVVVKNAPLQIWRKYSRGGYPHLRPSELAPLVQGRSIRFGSYGDPAAVPIAVWQKLARMATRTTGYTHQWQQSTQLRPYCMASVDTPEELATAQSAGWRTFRVKSASDLAQIGEIACPASAESGHRTTCADCTLCNGRQRTDDQRKSIVINAHGIGAMSFKRAIALTLIQ